MMLGSWGGCQLLPTGFKDGAHRHAELKSPQAFYNYYISRLLPAIRAGLSQSALGLLPWSSSRDPFKSLLTSATSTPPHRELVGGKRFPSQGQDRSVYVPSGWDVLIHSSNNDFKLYTHTPSPMPPARTAGTLHIYRAGRWHVSLNDKAVTLTAATWFIVKLANNRRVIEFVRHLEIVSFRLLKVRSVQ